MIDYRRFWEDVRAGRSVSLHNHTARCHHAVGEEREYIEAYIRQGFDMIGISDHTPLLPRHPKLDKVRMAPEELDEYMETERALIREYRDQIEIHVGLEMEYLAGRIDGSFEMICPREPEYLILGQHYMDIGEEPGTEYQATSKAFDRPEWLRWYVRTTVEALQTGRFLYIAHPDLPNFEGSQVVYEQEMRPLLEEMIRQNMPYEVNIHGFRDDRNYPAERFVRMGVEAGLDFFLGVDAHDPVEVQDLTDYYRAADWVDRLGGKLIGIRRQG